MTDPGSADVSSASATPDRRLEGEHQCDLIMKGGITSGIVYPRAVHRLARHYRFRSIGGASAGAIAAALTAAAEFGRRRGRDRFGSFERLPKELGGTDASGRTLLLRLFAPDAATRPSFAWLLSFLDAGSSPRSRTINVLQRAGRLTLAAIPRFPGAAMAAFVIAAVVGSRGLSTWPQGLVDWGMASAALLGTVLIFIALTLMGAIAGSIAAIRGNDFGLVKGRDSLTAWLHDKIQTYSGRPSYQPLTFGDLWGAGEHAPHQRDIDLRMMTSCLSHGRGYCFPLEPNLKFYFKPDELRTLFPAEVVDWMESRARPAKDTAIDRALASEGLCRLPLMKDLPILVVVRMSLAFPILLSAVPLWELRFRKGGASGFNRVWFSDGGLISNFPIHLFDALVPTRPTFGISLVDGSTVPEGARDPKDHVFIPRWFGPKQPDFHALSEEQETPARAEAGSKARSQPSLLAFVSAIFETLHGWTDRAQERVPGYQERVVSIALRKGEGGLNLRMEPTLIETLAARGDEAAERLLLHYHSDWQAQRNAQQPPIRTTWRDHRWVRYRNAGMLIEEALEGLLHADEVSKGTADDLRPTHAKSRCYPLGSRWQPALATYDDLLEVGRKLRARRKSLAPTPSGSDRVPGDDGVYGGPRYPRPRSRLRVMPRD
jgi:predicted acylesterase/phospholipase RssA